MKIARSAGRTTRLKRSVEVLVLCLVCVVGLSGCPQLLCDIGISDLCVTSEDDGDSDEYVTTYTVTYSPNGASSGSVPLDYTEYQEGQTVTVLSNTGNLARTGYSFTGWNTTTDRNGTTYTSGNTFTMGTAHLTLYAKWSSIPTYTVT